MIGHKNWEDNVTKKYLVDRNRVNSILGGVENIQFQLCVDDVQQPTMQPSRLQKPNIEFR